MAAIPTEPSPLAAIDDRTGPPARYLPKRGTVLGPAAAAGFLLALSVPPAGWWPLGIIGTGLLGFLLGGRRARTRALTGFIAGIALYGVTLLWMAEFNLIGAVLVMALEAGFLALAALLTRPDRWRALTWPAAVLVSDGVRSVVPFGGLPMGGIDLGQAGGPLAPAARLGGPLVLAALVAVAGLGLEAGGRLAGRVWRAWRSERAAPGGRARAGADHQPRPSSRWLVAVAGVATAVTVAVAAAGSASADGRVVSQLRVALVQGGGRRGLHAIENPAILVYQAQLAADARLRPPIDLVLWPENVIALDGPLAGSPESVEVGAEARRLGTTLVAGITEPVGDTRFRNAAVVWGPDGAVVARFDKVHRVPFGEYIPGRSFIRHLVNLDVVPRDAIAGHGSGMLDTPAGPVGIVVSYEVFFANRARSAIRGGGQILLVPTNTASYSTSQIPDAEIATARLRAWETGRDVVMAAPTGFSAILSPRGRVRARTGLGEQAVRTATVARRRGSTPYLRLGDTPFVAGAFLVLLACWALALGGERRANRSPGRRLASPGRPAGLGVASGPGRAAANDRAGAALLDRPVNTSKP